MKLLIVDDNAGARYVKSRMLRYAGYAVLEASSGAEALRLVTVEQPDLVLLDVRLPDISGFEVCHRIKGNPATAGIIVVQTSASYVEGRDRVRGLEEGADVYITEPVQPEVLTATVKAMLRLRQAEQALRQTRDALEERVRERTTELERAIRVLRQEVRKRRHSEEALQTSQRFLQSTLDALPSHVAILDGDGIILDVNASWLFFGTAEEFAALAYGRGMRFGVFLAKVTGTPDAAAVATVLTGVQEVVTRQRDTFFCEFTCQRRGESQCFFVRTTRFDAAEGGRVVVVLENITEIKRAEEALRQQQEALYQSEKLATMGSLLASVAHELNNPLAVMHMQLDLLVEETQHHTLHKRILEVRETTERCTQIVQSFLTLARRSTPQRTPIQLNAVVTAALQLLGHTLRLDNIVVRQQLAEDLPLIGANAAQLQQVFMNLLLNAQHALQGLSDPSALRQVTLTTCFDAPRQRVSLEIADTGPGIPIWLEERIFEPFFTTKPVGVGTGLGLSVCRGIIEGHGGSIRVVHRPDSGAVFQIELPAAAVPVPEFVEGAMLPAAAGTIIIVDDEVGIANGFARLLRRDGHTVDTAKNGREALHMLQTRQYDLILCDLRMPELDGPGLYRAVADQQPHLLSRFIFLTGDTLSQEASGFLAQAGAPHLVKPFSSTEGRRLVYQALRATYGIASGSP